MHATLDRAEIIHFAGWSRRSPALREGAPALVGHGEAGERCGWEPFFRALTAKGLAVAFDPGTPGEPRFVPRAEAEPHLGSARRTPVAEARRFLSALRGAPPAAR
ncbi:MULTISPECIES: hypothetical protein [Anaeromyxobacter]|uniref:hypothetical protein n=1 Tax=Anaeromyxobacter TaxID=161492 RepID=UPI001F593192|nr:MULTISPECIES: hypothetical protein [unclassified Anaeromyxobacter]